MERWPPALTVYLTRELARFARKALIDDAKLLRAARDVVAGRFDADLGGGVFKQRVARDGGGKSGGFRTIVLFRVGGHCFLAHGFAKSAKANVTAKALKALKMLAGVLSGLSAPDLRVAVEAGELIEVKDDEGIT